MPKPFLVNSFLLLPLKRSIIAFLVVLFSLSLQAQPIISSFSPASGPVGATVTITGSNFSTTPANNIVFFGAVRANVTAASASSLTVVVPAGSTYQPITVTTSGLTGYSARPFVATFTGGGQINSSLFSERIDSTTDLHPNGIAIADFDGDGKPDIATPNNYSTSGQPASISILRNIAANGTIAFAPKQDINNGVLTYAIASGDLDGDGKPDLIACSIADLNISVFRNTSTPGSVSFAPKVNYASTSGVHGIAIGDFDGDGKPDITIVNSTSNSISLYRNTSSVGLISFAAKIDFTTGLFPEYMAIGDFDSDGKPDVVVTNNLSNSFSAFRNTSTAGNISFSARTDIATGGTNAPYGIAVGDMDGDLKADVAVVITNSSGVCGTQLYRNTSTTGNISFNYTLTVTGVSGTTAYHTALGDINGDGKPDIAMSNTGAGLVQVYQNNSTVGTLAFAPANSFPGIFGPYAVAIGDMNADNKPDLIASEFTLDKVSVYKSKCGSPGVVSFSPVTAAAGATVTITGSNFSGVTGVTFGGIPASSFIVVNATTITAVVGTGASGDVVVTNSAGSGGKSGFQFAGPPVINSFTPASGFSGTTITISGLNFNGTSTVRFGGTDASSFSVIDPFTIIATVGFGTTGNVSVSTTFGTGSLAGFIYAPVPIINSFTPTSAATGSTVTISGINFAGTTTVSFGGITASSFTVVNSNTITAVVANGASGDVVVTNAFGTNAKSGFTYLAPPTISSFTPVTGGTGTSVVISGTNFNNVSVVKFGGTNANSFNVINSTTINAVVDGNGSSGAVSVTAQGGTATLAGFTFIPAPTITSFSPVTTGSGATVTITGTNFTGATVVSFGGVAASSFTVVNSTTINAVVAIASSGNVSVTTPGGTATVAGFGYTIAPVINSISPLSGPVGTTVTITGANFGVGAAGNVVYFGGIKGSIISASANVIAVTVPAGATNKPVLVTSLLSSLTAVSEASFKITFAGDPNAFNASSFAGQMNFRAGINPNDIDLGDVDGDGKLDIVVTNYNSPFISIFRNISISGQLAFAEKVDFNIGLYANNTVMTDMNGDGKLDLVVAKHYLPLTGNSDILILTNNSTSGTIAFNPPQTFFTFDIVIDIAVGDLNNDGKPDIAGICINCGIDAGGFVTVFHNTSSGGNLNFTTYRTGFTGSAPGGTLMKGIEMIDLNKDNKPELIIGSTSNAFVILKNGTTTGSIMATFNQQIIGDFFSGGSFSNIQFNDDFDFDGKTDILTTNWINTNSGVNISGNYNISRQQNLSIGAGLTTDLNGDGKPDILTQGTSIAGANDKISVFKNLSIPATVSFAAPFNYTANNTLMKLDAGDLDGDGKPEICSANYGLNNISIYRNRIAEPVLAPPTISSFTPVSAGYLAQVTITGTNFSQATSVSFGTVAASFFTVVSPTTIIASVGNGVSGSVSVTTPGGTASLAGFSFIAVPSPTITSFTPISGGQGTIITITGTNFTNATAVSFGGQSAINFVVTSPTTIVATLGLLDASGSVSVITPGGTASLPGFTYIFPPAISSFSPSTGAAGTTITITGTNLTSATAVSFGGIPATSFTVVNATTITAVVGSGSSGSISVTTSGGTATRAGFTFIPGPGISSFAPTNAATGGTVTITGTNFTGATAVSFGGVAAQSFTVNSATSIAAVIGAGASGNVNVVTPNGTATLAGFTYNIVTGLGDPNSNNSKELTINPNPGNGIVVIKHPATIKKAQIRFIDMLGRVVKEIVPLRNTGQTDTDITSLPQGIYKIVWNDGSRILSRTFMVK